MSGVQRFSLLASCLGLAVLYVPASPGLLEQCVSGPYARSEARVVVAAQSEPGEDLARTQSLEIQSLEIRTVGVVGREDVRAVRRRAAQPLRRPRLGDERERGFAASARPDADLPRPVAPGAPAALLEYAP